MQVFNGAQKKPPSRVTIPAEEKLLVSRDEAAQLLSISQRGLDYLIANRRLPTRRIGGRGVDSGCGPAQVRPWRSSREHRGLIQLRDSAAHYARHPCLSCSPKFRRRSIEQIEMAPATPLL